MEMINTQTITRDEAIVIIKLNYGIIKLKLGVRRKFGRYRKVRKRYEA